MLKVISAVCVLVTVVSCKKHLNRVDYAHYVESPENGLKKVRLINDWEYTMMYRPVDYILLLESRNEGNSLVQAKRKTQLEGIAWFNISFKRADNQVSPLRWQIASIEEYNERVNYYLNEASKDIRLVYGADTLSPSNYVFENNYNLTPQETIVVGFSLPNGDHYPKHDMRLSMTDRIYSNGIIATNFSSGVLDKIPALIF